MSINLVQPPVNSHNPSNAQSTGVKKFMRQRDTSKVNVHSLASDFHPASFFGHPALSITTCFRFRIPCFLEPNSSLEFHHAPGETNPQDHDIGLGQT
jgi:hypothetical protein